jgi:hypothetical protein
MHTLPINIPIKTNMHKSSSFSKLSASPSPSQSPVQSSSLPSRINHKKVVLYGAPFKNNETISTLLKDCVDELNTETITKIMKDVEENKKDSITVITCTETKAVAYCQRLVENGLIAGVE